MPSLQEVNKYSNYTKAKRQTRKFLGKNAKLFLSTRKNKKFMVIDPETGHKIHFGQMGYEDFTKHNDPKRRENYMRRTANIRGQWRNDKYSPNMLSRCILWREW